MFKRDLPNEEYHASPGISKSQLDVFARSPHHYYWQYKSGVAPPRRESDAMRQGTIIHAAILEPERFSKEYVVGELRDKRSKKWKDFVEECANDGKCALTQIEFERAMRCQTSVMKNSYAAAALSDGEAEVSAFTEEPEADGMQVRSRFDWLTQGAIVDLKTTVDAGPAFAQSIRKFRYHLQAAMYTRVGELCGITNCAFVFVVVEREFPYGVGVYELDPSDASRGLHMYYDLITRLSVCEKTNEWPGYTTGIETIQAYTR